MQLDERSRTSVPNAIASPRAKLVYLCLLVTDGATVTELQELLSLKKITILSVLDSLTELELVAQRDHVYACV
ncbi:MarR family transcriptional regulator [Natribaculum luteum]|uniref:MarR family transcriptional regulator n=1 Tax=Natribaculum luteum TaxID=1586232 RepID=A0ABD5NXG3_9EURY|nr:MarR family transcriptional regulator [Natribaculum luteum]